MSATDAVGRWIDRARLRLRSLFRRRAADVELAREIALHIDEQAHELIARGMSPAAARDAARRAFGPVAAIEDQCRDTRCVMLPQNLLQDLRYGLRSLLAQRLLVVAATGSIAIATGANTLIFGLASELLLAPPSVRQARDVVNIRISNNSHVSYAEWRALSESGALAGLAGYNVETSINWRDGAHTTTIVPLIVTSNFFEVLGVPIALGRGFAATEAAAEREPRVTVISHGFWKSRLNAEPAIVGRTLIVNGEGYTVLGVLPAGLRAFPGFGLAPEIYLPQSRSITPDLDQRYGASVQLVGRLRDGQSVEQGRAALNTVVQRRATGDGEHRPAITLFAPVSDGVPDLGDISTFFTLLLMVVALVLAIACANVAGLLLARGTVRRREIAVRLALGATRARLVQQLLVECLWLAVAGTGAGLLIMFGVMQLISRVPWPLPLPLELGAPLDARLFTYALGIVLGATLFSGLLPALQATRPSLTPALKQDDPRYVHRRWTLRGLLVMAQVAVSIVLLVTAFLFLRNLARAQTMNPGFDTARTLVSQVSFVEGRHTPESRVMLLRNAVDRLETLPGIERASFALGTPLTVRNGRTSVALVPIEGEGDKSAFQARWSENMVGPGYFQTLGIPFLQGRDFAQHDAPGSPLVIIVNEEFVRRYLGARPPLGVRLLLPGAAAPDPYEIVGVVGNSKHRTLGESQMAAIYFSYMQRPGGGRFVHVLARATAAPEGSIAAVARTIEDLDSSAAVEVQTMRQTLAFAFLPSQVGGALVGSLGFLGLTLAMGGLFAMLSYSVTRRTKEIGVRMALGASTRSVARLVVRDAALLVACGVLIGIAIAALVTGPLAMFLVEGLSVRDPVSFGGTTLLFALVSLVSIWIPMKRAMRVEPAVALRDE